MMNRISGSVTQFVRSRYPYVVLIMTMAIFGTGTAVPAHAGTIRAAGVDGCTTTNAVGKLVNLGVNNLVNPIKQYGWVIAAALVLVGLFLAWTNIGGRWLKAGFIVLVVMVIGIPIYNEIRAGDGNAPCSG